MSAQGINFLNSIFSENLVFISFLGVLLLFIEARGLRKSLSKGLKFSLALLISMVLGWVFSGWVEGEIITILVFWLSSLGGIFLLYTLGELRGDWMGIPRIIIAMAPFLGSQWLIYEQGIDYFNQIYPISGTVVGFYFAFVLTAAVREQIKISEIPDYIKEKPLLLITMGFFALALIGFNFM